MTFYHIMFLFVLFDVFGLNSVLPNIRLAALGLELFYLVGISFPILFIVLAFESLCFKCFPYIWKTPVFLCMIF